MHNQLYGIYASYIEQYVALKRELGLKYNMEEFIYTLFDRFTIARGEKNVGITKDLADEWNSKKSNESETYQIPKSCMFKSTVIISLQVGNEIHTCPSYRHSKSASCPHIFSKQEIASIFAACDNITLQSGMKSIIIILPALIRLLYGTGLRISEALSLRNEDINLVDQFLIVRDSKNGTERIIPLSDSLSEVCREYLKYRDKLPLARIDNYFFVSLAGSVCKPDYIRKWFSKILREAGINRNDTGPKIA